MSLRRRSRVRLNEGWRFSLDGEPWRGVTLPHSWNALDTMDTDPRCHYRRGTGTYERELPATAMRPGDRLWLEVEAAAMKATVRVGDIMVGGHEGGYTGFTLEIPASGLLRLIVDNLPDPDLIPSDLSDFFQYGGLTRNVWLHRTGPARIASVRAESEVDACHARVRLSVTLDGEAEVWGTLRDPDGTVVSEAIGRSGIVDFGEVLHPRLWSPAQPALYEASIAAGDSDQVSLYLGLRWFDFPPHGEFDLNGSPLKLHGTHRHEDWAGLGSAVPDHMSHTELELVRKAGFNFIRLGHYPQAPAVLDACDELGILVWEELPWCRGGVGGELFKSRARRMLAEMIEQHQHHPSIVFWGLGNELDWEVSDHPASSEEAVLDFTRELHELAHRLDPDRLTALRRFEAGASAVDVYSPSIWSGWYRGRYQDYEAAVGAAVPRYARMLHMEWGADSHFGRHGAGPHVASPLPAGSDHAERIGDASTSFGPARASRDGDWSESYALDLMEWHLQVQLQSHVLAGSAQWAFKDFGTPLRPENPIPYVNQKGLLDRAGRPKDAYHLFRSYLSTEPMCHIESETWPTRVGAAGEPQRVRVYSNCPSVELFVDGRSLGSRLRDPAAFPAAGLVWQVHLAEGLHRLRAVATGTDGTEVVHQIEQEFVAGPEGPAVRMDAAARSAYTPDGRRGVRVAVRLVDAAGVPAVDDRRRLLFELEGSGRLWDRRGTADGSAVVEAANGRAAIHVVDRGDEAGAVIVEAPGLPSIRVPLPV